MVYSSFIAQLFLLKLSNSQKKFSSHNHSIKPNPTRGQQWLGSTNNFWKTVYTIMPKSADVKKPEEKENYKKTPGKTWFGTLNNWTLEEKQQMLDMEGITIMVIGEEVGAEGTPHLQYAVTFKNAYRFSSLKKIWKRHHFFQPKCKDAAFNYCMKDCKYEKIDNRQQGKRTDLEDVKEKVMSGASERQLWKENFETMSKFHNGIRRAMAVLNTSITKPRETNLRWQLHDWPECGRKQSLILWGASGIGKTEFAKQHFPNGCLMICHLDQLSSFDPAIHEGIIFDDMDFKHLPRSTQIFLADRDEDRAIHIRYGIAVIPAGTRKIFTTNLEGGSIFDLDDAAIKSRVYAKHMISL